MKKNNENSNHIILQELSQTADFILNKALALGASEAEVSLSNDEGLSIGVRLGDLETLEFHQGKTASVTIYLGKRCATASTTDLSPTALNNMVQSAHDIAQFTEEDPCFGLADKTLLAKNSPDLAQYYPWDIDSKTAIKQAIDSEKKALSMDKRIVNSDGISFDKQASHFVYANTNDFIGYASETSYMANCSLIAQDGKDMQRASEYTVAYSPDQLKSLDDVALSAGEQAIQQLNPRKLPTQQASVIFDARVSAHLISALISAISGGNLYRETTFLLNHLGKPIFPEWMNVLENPHQLNTIGCAAFDSEGVLTRKKHFIESGILTSYVLGSYSARRLGLVTTANAGGVFNVLLDVEKSHAFLDQKTLLKAMGTGVLVTSLMGSGINMLTGDYSRGASGFWVENGEIQYPVQEFTVASNLKAMFMNIQAIAQDIDYRKNIKAGSIWISDMTIAGE